MPGASLAPAGPPASVRGARAAAGRMRAETARGNSRGRRIRDRSTAAATGCRPRRDWFNRPTRAKALAARDRSQGGTLRRARGHYRPSDGLPGRARGPQGSTATRTARAGVVRACQMARGQSALVGRLAYCAASSRNDAARRSAARTRCARFRGGVLMRCLPVLGRLDVDVHRNAEAQRGLRGLLHHAGDDL